MTRSAPAPPAGSDQVPLLLTGGRLVPVGSPPIDGPGEPVDVLLRHGEVAAVGPGLTAPAGVRRVDLAGRWLLPGLWDHHVHMSQWAQRLRRVDLTGASGPDAVVHAVAEHVASLPPAKQDSVVQGWGHRTAAWDRPATVAALDAVSGDHPVVLVSGDGHSGWLNSHALTLLGLPPRKGPLDEAEWFAVYRRLGELPGATAEAEAGYADALADAAARGVVGIVDMEFDAASGRWPERYAAGLDTLRVRTSVYPDALDRVLQEGRRTGDPWEGCAGRVRMGPLKIISDGSLGTRTAHCCDPYPPDPAGQAPYGKQNVPAEELDTLLKTAAGHGLDAAVHAIGDAAVGIALDAFATTGARGSIEHAQLVSHDLIRRMADLQTVASVQPAHLLDDRDLTARWWPGREERCFMLRSMLDAGVRLALGSDAPVAPLDPWLAIAAAVHRSADDRDPWVPGEAITAAEALAASTDGWGTLRPGHPADVVALDADPLGGPTGDDTASAAAYLRRMPVAVTVVDGRVVHDTR